MVDIQKEVYAEEENIIIALKNLKKTAQKRKRTAIELAAMGTFLSNIYNGMENILKQALKAKGKKIPNSGSWHKSLIKVSVDIGVLPEELSQKLYEYLGFRHFFIHGYGFELEWAKMKSLVNNIEEVWLRFRKCIGEFLMAGNKKHL